jgi:cleavage stimulation factor subunit 3
VVAYELNLEQDARALFEKTVGLFEPEKARPLWQRWLMYQMNVADLPTLHKLDKRVAEAYPKGQYTLSRYIPEVDMRA